MNANQFDKKVRDLVKTCPMVTEDNHYQYRVETPAGLWKFSLEWTPRIKVGHIHSRFENYNADQFNVVFPGFGAGAYTHKWNTYSRDPEFIMDMIEEILENLNFINQEA